MHPRFSNIHDAPWIVQEFDGPVEGSVSQNWVWRSKPCKKHAYGQFPARHHYSRAASAVRTPGDSKQHRSVSFVVLWHDAGPLVEQPELIRLKRSIGPKGVKGEGPATAVPARAAPRARVAASIPN